MKLGFTGTREPVTDAQKTWLTKVFKDLKVDQFHHGACTGADEFAHEVALSQQIPIVVHPPVNPKHLARVCLLESDNVRILPAKPYLNRNRDIVGATEGLIALPKQDSQPGEMYWGGTWYTVNYAERMLRTVIICYPNGRSETREAKGVRG